VDQETQQGAQGQPGEPVGGRHGQQRAQAGAGRDTQAVGHDAHAQDEQSQAAEHGEDQEKQLSSVHGLPSEDEGHIFRKASGNINLCRQ